MRIIGGTAKGRRLRAPSGCETRPTTDRVREALFSMVTARLPSMDVSALDLFAGSGALGLEALSRGASDAVFVDRDRRCREVIATNARTLGLESGATILCMTVRAAIGLLARQGRMFDLVFLDPPYATEPWTALDALAEHGLLAAGALVVAEHATKAIPPASPEGLALELTRRYGDTAVTLYARSQDEAVDLPPR